MAYPPFIRTCNDNEILAWDNGTIHGYVQQLVVLEVLHKHIKQYKKKDHLLHKDQL